MRESEKTIFDKEIRVLLADVAAWFNPRPENVRGYWDAVVKFDLELVRKAFEHIRSNFTGHFTPADVRNAAHEALKATRRRVDEKPAHQVQVDPRGQEYDDCKHDAYMAYAFKVCGQRPGTKGKAVDRYTGGFDWSPSVKAGPIPTGDDPASHDKAWKAFISILQYEWDQWTTRDPTQTT